MDNKDKYTQCTHNEHNNARNNTFFIIWSLFFIFLLGCSSLQSTEREEQQDVPTITIGVIAPLTGGNAVGGIAVEEGILLGLEDINLQGGIKGQKLNVIIEDSQSSVKNAVTSAKKLIETNNVFIIIGGGLSAEAMALAPIAEESHVIFLSSIALTTPLETAGDWVFKLRESTGKHAYLTLKEMHDLGYQHIGILAQQHEVCDDFLSQMEKYYALNGIQIKRIERFEGQEAKQSDVRTQLLKLNQQNIDALFICGLYNELAQAFKQMK